MLFNNNYLNTNNIKINRTLKNDSKHILSNTIDYSVKRLYIAVKKSDREKIDPLYDFFNKLNIKVRLIIDFISNTVINELNKDKNLFILIIDYHHIIFNTQSKNINFYNIPKFKYILYQLNDLSSKTSPGLNIDLINNSYMNIECSEKNLKFYQEMIRPNIKISNTILDLNKINFNKKYICLYDEYPDIINAEKQLIERYKYAINENNYDYLIINNKGTITNNCIFKDLNIEIINKNIIKFIIYLHNTFSFYSKIHLNYMTLWNPMDFIIIQGNFYHYKLINKFVSSYSDIIDDFISINFHLKPDKYLTTSLSSSNFLKIDNININKLFYIGSNWDIIAKKAELDNIQQSKIDLIQKLDKIDLINIYGKKNKDNFFNNLNNYKGELPFDLSTILKEIKISGIGLVLHTKYHKKSNIISMRTFECIAAGVPIIADKNNFLDKFFGDNIFYIDIDQDTLDVTVNKIKSYIDFINNNKSIVLDKIDNTRRIFKEYFCLKKQIKNLLE